MIIDTLIEDLPKEEKAYIDEMEMIYSKGEQIIDNFISDLGQSESK